MQFPKYLATQSGDIPVSEFAQQDENEHEDQYCAETTAAVVPSPVKATAADAAESAQQRDNEYD
jgi:hypothetical protein